MARELTRRERLETLLAHENSKTIPRHEVRFRSFCLECGNKSKRLVRLLTCHSGMRAVHAGGCSASVGVRPDCYALLPVKFEPSSRSLFTWLSYLQGNASRGKYLKWGEGLSCVVPGHRCDTSRAMPPLLTPNTACWHLQLVKSRTPARHRELAGDTVLTSYSHTTKEDMAKAEMREMQINERNAKYQVRDAVALAVSFDTPTCYCVFFSM